MSKVVFQDPPQPLRRGEVPWQEVLQPLVTRPGDWAKVWTFSSSGGATNAMARLRNRSVAIPDPGGVWEFTTRKEEDGKRSLYARYIGPTKKRPPRQRSKVGTHRSKTGAS